METRPQFHTRPVIKAHDDGRDTHECDAHVVRPCLTEMLRKHPRRKEKWHGYT